MYYEIHNIANCAALALLFMAYNQLTLGRRGGWTFRASSRKAAQMSPSNSCSPFLQYFQSLFLQMMCIISAVVEVGPCPAMEDKWGQCYHLTNPNVFEGSSIALSDLLLINAAPLLDSV